MRPSPADRVGTHVPAQVAAAWSALNAAYRAGELAAALRGRHGVPRTDTHDRKDNGGLVANRRRIAVRTTTTTETRSICQAVAMKTIFVMLGILAMPACHGPTDPTSDEGPAASGTRPANCRYHLAPPGDYMAV